jgi:coenzyme F420 hydrogenase subunit beta
MICPARNPFGNRIGNSTDGAAPVGRVIDVSVARASDNDIRQRGFDGGVVTALLLHLLSTGRIGGAVVSRQYGLFQRCPHLAATRAEIVEAAGSCSDTRCDMAIGNHYSTFSQSIQAFKYLMAKNLHRIAFVGVPCQIEILRNMQTQGIFPADTVHIALGLFCSGSYEFSGTERMKLERFGGFRWKDALCMNLRNHGLMIQLKDGATTHIELDLLSGMRRTACSHCQDYSAELADLSFGGTGAPESWTTVVVRTPVGRAAFTDAMGIAVNEYRIEDNPHFAREALQQVQLQSVQKKRQAQDGGDKPPWSTNYGKA